MHPLIAETPLWLPAGLALLGIGLFITGNNRLDRKLKRAGLVLLGAAVLLALVSYLLESDREIVTRRTRQVVAAVEDRDWPTLERLMHPEISVHFWIDWRGRERILAGIRNVVERYEVKNIRMAGMEVTGSEPSITAAIQVAAHAGGFSGFVSNWALKWEREGEQWLLYEIEPQGGPMMSASELERRAGRPPGQ